MIAKTKSKPKAKAKNADAVKRPIERSKVKEADTWDLSSLYPSDEAWEKGLARWEKMIHGYEAFHGKLDESAAALAKCLVFDEEFDRLAERIGSYVHLKTTQDQTDAKYQEMMGRFQAIASRASQAASYIRPEVMAIPTAKMNRFLESAELSHYRLLLERILRYKKHTLGKKEEMLLAMQSEMAGVSTRAFQQLTAADMKFGVIKNEHGEQVELSNASFTSMLESPSRKVRQNAFKTFYAGFVGHENTLATLLAGSIQRGVYYAKARGYSSAIESALYADDVPLSVYDNLISTVHNHLPAVHRYYELRRRKMKLPDIHHYDCYVPILADAKMKNSWAQATKHIIASLAPLGSDYCKTLEKGLNGRWCDRYPNRGKDPGAFSAGSFDGDPYILMNYQDEVLSHMFTLTHEAGHSMHSYNSAKHQPFTYYSYVIFVAEVASTFNEQLLSHYLRQRAKTKEERAYLINRDIDAIRSTIVRQTMFAEFEKITHAMAEAGEALTVQSITGAYRKLLDQYFGPKFVIDDELSRECLRIPHFYRAFYVYKYATGLSAAIALSERVLNGGAAERNAFLNFLKSGGSKWPLELLRDAGVDMETPAPIDAALTKFASLVDELETLL